MSVRAASCRSRPELLRAPRDLRREARPSRASAPRRASWSGGSGLRPEVGCPSPRAPRDLLGRLHLTSIRATPRQLGRRSSNAQRTSSSGTAAKISPMSYGHCRAAPGRRCHRRSSSVSPFSTMDNASWRQSHREIDHMPYAYRRSRRCRSTSLKRAARAMRTVPSAVRRTGLQRRRR